MTSALPPDLINPAKALIIFVVVTALGLSLRYGALRTLSRWAERTATHVDDMLLESLRFPSLVWCLLVGVYIAVDTAHMPPRLNSQVLNVVFALLVVSVTAAIANLAGTTIGHILKENNLAIPATGLSLTIIKIAVWTTGGLVLLSGLGVSIAPILTALGVGGLAVALALQDTLSNFFAGIHLLIEEPVRVGDFVRLETGQEGYIVDIGWRTTRIRMLPNNMVIIPNNKLTQSVLINYSMPEPRMAVSIPIGVAYAADPTHVERVLTEEASKAAGQIPGLLPDPAPAVRLIPGFGDSSLNFTLSVHVRQFEDQFPVQHELRMRIFRRFQQEGIEIPFPQQTVHLRTEPEPRQR